MLTPTQIIELLIISYLTMLFVVVMMLVAVRSMRRAPRVERIVRFKRDPDYWD